MHSKAHNQDYLIRWLQPTKFSNETTPCLFVDKSNELNHHEQFHTGDIRPLQNKYLTYLIFLFGLAK